MPPKKRDEDKFLNQHFTIHPDLYRQVVEWCERNDRSFSWTICRALKEFLIKHKDESLD